MTNKKTGFKPSLYSSFIVRNLPVRIILNNIKLMINLIIVLFRGTPRLVGERRLQYHIVYLLRKYNKSVLIAENSLWIENKKVGIVNSALQGFIPLEGFIIHPENENRIREIFIQKLCNDNPSVTKKYYKASALYWLSFSLALFANIMIILTFLENAYYFGYGQIASTLFWISANTFILIQMYIFHKTRLRSIALENNIVEATSEEEESLLLQEESPGSLIIVPAYKEEAELLKRSLFSHMIQKYTNKEVVLLLGNEYYTDNSETLTNTQQVKEVVSELNREFFDKKQFIKESLKTLSQPLSLSLKMIYDEISQWLSEKGEEILSSSDKYPTDDFVVKECFFAMRDYYKERSSSLETMTASELEKEASYCRKIFSVNISVFMRTQYPNLEQEKTKAGNLTAYLPFINRDSKEVPSHEPGKMNLIPGELHNRHQYISIFDCDTIPKPEYLLRKIIYLEKESHQKIGLIQSPYVVPDPEPTITGSASGVHSYWFLPISIGLTSYGSAFWLGFNSCWRYDTLKQIPDFMAETIIEDVEVSLKILSTGYKIITSPEIQCITFSPTDLKGVQVQRTRWASGGLRIIKIFLKLLKEKKYSVSGFKEFSLRINYIVNLNLLPFFITLLFIIQTPIHYKTIHYISFQFISYLWVFFLISTRNTKYKISNLIDGLCLSLFMNFYYLRGLARSLKVFFKPEKDQFFNSTPRSSVQSSEIPVKKTETIKKKIYQVGAFEVLGVFYLLFIFSKALVHNISMYKYADLFPIYQIFCLLYCVGRFIGFRHFFKSVFNHLILRPLRILKPRKS